MTPIEQAYEHFKAQLGAGAWPEHVVPGGKVVASPDGMRCLVWTDGRYPSWEEGYHVNDAITETEEILWGAAVIELAGPFELSSVKAGERVALMPGRPYSVGGKCVSLITMDKPWDSAQKRLVRAEPPPG